MGSPTTTADPHSLIVDGHRLYLESLGDGVPTVVFENGLGGSLEEWAIIQPEVAQSTRTVVYDRAGLGRSERAKRSPDGITVARELRAALASAGERPPYVLVGHSLGGVLIRLFAHLYPEEVAGLVFVDSSHPEQIARLSLPWWARALVSLLPALPLLARLHVPIYRYLAQRSTPSKGFPPDAFQRMLDYYGQPAHLSTIVQEYGALDEIFAQGRMTGDLGNRPIAVLSAGSPPGRLVDAFQMLHRELVALSPRSSHEIVEKAAHVSIVTEHDHALVVVDAICRVVDQVRADTDLRFDGAGSK